jgi:Regulator of chromosome condensation (RCC1) repeat
VAAEQVKEVVSLASRRHHTDRSWRRTNRRLRPLRPSARPRSNLPPPDRHRARPRHQHHLSRRPGPPEPEPLAAPVSCGTVDRAPGQQFRSTRGRHNHRVDHPGELSQPEWQQTTAGWSHSCGIRVDGTAWCWGANGSGQLGDGTTAKCANPTQVGTATTWATIFANRDHTCAVRTGACFHSRWRHGLRSY